MRYCKLDGRTVIVGAAIFLLLLLQPSIFMFNNGTLSASDFNDDGFSDLAIGVPFEDLGHHMGAGAVHLLYGTSDGLQSDNEQFWNQREPKVSGRERSHDNFGEELSAGDFNGDGYSDLAVGIPMNSVGLKLFSGAVNVFYGSASGVVTEGNQLWTQDSEGIAETSEAQDLFGEELAVGDFNGDGYSDLAIGAPFEDTDDMVNTGVVHILYGSALGLTAEGDQIFQQGTNGILEVIESGDMFGEELDVGDFNGDGYSDLIIGVAFEDLGVKKNAGMVHILYGSKNGLSAVSNQIFSQGDEEVIGKANKGDLFGAEISVGDFNGDGFSDVSVAAYADDLPGAKKAGAVNVFYGSIAGLSATDGQYFHQDIDEIHENAEAGDFFGYAMYAGDFNGDGMDDLAIAAPGEDVGEIVDAGNITILYGSQSSLTADGSQIWHQNSSDILGSAEEDDMFGWDLSAGDYNGDGFVDLAVGLLDQIGEIKAAGAIQVIYGSPIGLSATNNQLWHQNSPGISDEAEANDLFGYVVY